MSKIHRDPITGDITTKDDYYPKRDKPRRVVKDKNVKNNSKTK